MLLERDEYCGGGNSCVMIGANSSQKHGSIGPLVSISIVLVLLVLQPFGAKYPHTEGDTATAIPPCHSLLGLHSPVHLSSDGMVPPGINLVPVLTECIMYNYNGGKLGTTSVSLEKVREPMRCKLR